MCVFPMMESRCIFKGVNHSAGSQLSVSRGGSVTGRTSSDYSRLFFTHKDTLSYRSSVFIVKAKASAETRKQELPTRASLVS